MESFFSTVKSELGRAVREPGTKRQVELFDYIEVFYNQRRRHSTIGYLSPAAFERQAAARQGSVRGRQSPTRSCLRGYAALPHRRSSFLGHPMRSPVPIAINSPSWSHSPGGAAAASTVHQRVLTGAPPSACTTFCER